MDSPTSDILSFCTGLRERGDECQDTMSLSSLQHNSNSNAEISQTTFNSQASDHGRCNGSLPSTSHVISRISLDTTGSHASVPSMHVNVSEAQNCDGSSSLKKEISRLQNSIVNSEAELIKVSIRKEFLGRDSAGHLYWIFGKLGDSTEDNSSVRNSYLFAVESPSSSGGLSFSNMNPTERNLDIPVSSSWSYYQSDTEIEELLGWLSNNDARERELREAILHWQQNKMKDSNDAKLHFQNEMRSPLNFSICGKYLDSYFNATNAWTALKKKFGSLQVQAENIPEQRWHKAEETCQGTLYRCKCLEPLWPSKHHCLSCHRTFSTYQELDEHSNGTCNTTFSMPKIDVGSSKHKRSETETSLDKSSNSRIAKVPKGDNHKTISCSSDKNYPECPFDFEEIKTKFVTQNSLKDVAKEIGLIGSSGTPSLVPKIAPYLDDPSLSLLDTKNEVSSSSASKDVKNPQSKRKPYIYERLYSGNIASRLLKHPKNGMDEDPLKVDRSNFKCMGGKDQLSSTKKMLWGGKFAIIRENSLRPLTGRVSAILTQLKINLLDMDAALPEEAVRPSRANSEKRCIWRGFVKSAESIYEVSLTLPLPPLILISIFTIEYTEEKLFVVLIYP